MNKQLEQKLRKRIRTIVEGVLREESEVQVGSTIQGDGGYGKIVKSDHSGLVSWVESNKFGEPTSKSVYSYRDNHFNDLVKSGRIKVVGKP